MCIWVVVLSIWMACGVPQVSDDSPVDKPDGVTPILEPYMMQFEEHLLLQEEVLLGDNWAAYTPPTLGLALHDLNGDGWLDLLVSIPYLQSRLFLNDGQGGLVDSGYSIVPGRGVAVADLDGDGARDVVLARGADTPDRISFNDGTGRLVRHISLPDSIGTSQTPALGDMDGDGDLDLFISAFNDAGYVECESVGSGHKLFLNDEGTWTDATDRLPSEVLCTLSFHAVWLDADNDLDLDIYLSNDFGYATQPNRLLLNDGAGHFTISTDCYCDIQMNAMGVGLGDLDENGWIDIAISDLDGLEVLQGDEASFLNTTFSTGANPPRTVLGPTWGIVISDMDLDGRNDIIAVAGQVVMRSVPDGVTDYEIDMIMQAQADGTFAELPAGRGFTESSTSRAVVIGDLDRDGHPDLITSSLGRVQIWRNTTTSPPALTIRVNAGLGNPDGIGAAVRVEVQGRTHYRWIWPSTTFSSQAPEIYMGLGDAQQVDRITVTMPDGREQTVENVLAGGVIDVLMEQVGG